MMERRHLYSMDEGLLGSGDKEKIRGLGFFKKNTFESNLN